MRAGAPCHFVSHREYVSLCVEVLSHAHLPQVKDSHDTDIEWENGILVLIAWNSRDVGGLAHNSVGLEAFWLRVSLEVRRQGARR